MTQKPYVMQFPARMSNAPNKIVDIMRVVGGVAAQNCALLRTAPGPRGPSCAPRASCSPRPPCAPSAQHPRDHAQNSRVPINEARGQLLKRRINVRRTYIGSPRVRPPGQLQPGSSLRDRNAVDDGRPVRLDGLVQVTPVIRGRTMPSAQHPPELAAYPRKVSGAPLWSAGAFQPAAR